MIKRGQAGLDFLMTYGWALLLIVLVVGALFALGIFDISNFLGSRATGFTQIGVSAWRITPAGVLTMQFRNQAGTSINVTSINATLGTSTVNYGTGFNISNGQTSSTITVGTFGTPPSSGAGYSVRINIAYTDLTTGFAYADSGTITGRVN